MVTQETLKDEDITIDIISEKLQKLSSYLRDSNKKNLTDGNIICEEIFEKLLNLLLEINLKSKTFDDATYPSIDLIDYGSKTAFQITSVGDNSKSQKIRHTVEVFNRKEELYSGIEELNILFLSPKYNFKNTEDLDLKNGKKFTYRDNVYDLDRLIEMIENRGKLDSGLYVKVYDILNMAFDSGRLNYSSIVNESEKNAVPFKSDIPSEYVWKEGCLGVQLTAIISEGGSHQINAKVEFTKITLKDVSIILSHDILLRNYLIDEKAFKALHDVGRMDGDDNYYFDFENVRVCIDFHVAEQIWILFKKLRDDYFNKPELFTV